MIEISDQQFEQLIAEALDSLADKYARHMNNVAIVWDNEPTPEQRQKMKLRDYETLFGLYEGIPLPARGAGYNLVLPDKVTIFKNPIVSAARDMTDLRSKVHNTVWHEIAHHFGLNHNRIHELERRGTIGD
ncbi:MAG TPA: metallopeptidase family protein [Candidatus Saccharimonadales bacterium]|nr:metallopeptidase family protein [Candidatus Saccharimonadales bacterium]